MMTLEEFETQIPQAMRRDQFTLKRLLRSIRRAEQAGKPFDRNLAKLTKILQRSTKLRDARQNSLALIHYDETLPIYQYREELLEAIKAHQVTVVCGETGSGKSTQLPKFCLELGRGIGGTIGHTQPRRIAARSIAARIAEELAVELGEQVGFQVRFSDATKPHTCIKLMTDGILLAETQNDPYFDHYDTLILDEVHERSLNIDFLLGYLKRLLKKRRDLKVIVTSATMEVERYRDFFATHDCPVPIVEVSGRTYPVETRYRPVEESEEEDVIALYRQIRDALSELDREGPGDVLVFLPTERHIREVTQVLRGSDTSGSRSANQTEYFALYGRLPIHEQAHIFKPHKHRRIVLATNVAESSLTVPNIRYVIDSGTARISRYSLRSKVQRLPIEPVSQASADQRKGRCGRIGSGICVRLYSEEDFAARERYTPPEIQRTNLASVVLKSKALNLGNLDEFPFLDPPKPVAIREGHQTLFELGALDERQNLTKIGQVLADLPTDPRIGRMILAARDEDCLAEALIIAAALEVQDPRFRPFDQQQQADLCHAQFADRQSDFLSYLKIWRFFANLNFELSRGRVRKACKAIFLSYSRMQEWVDIHRQLLQLLKQDRDAEWPIHQLDLTDEAIVEKSPNIHRALLAGLLANVAYKSEQHEYIGSGGQKLFLWPGSGTFDSKPAWIMAAEFVETDRRFARTVAKIDSGWIEPLAQHLVTRSYGEPYWNGERCAAMADEKVQLFGMTIVPRRPLRLGDRNPTLAREWMIEHGLIAGDWEYTAPFLTHNAEIREQAKKLQAKSRSQEVVHDEEALFKFYDRRLPADVYDGPRLNRWRKGAEKQSPQRLFLSLDDLLKQADDSSESFPDELTVGQVELSLEYHWEPGTEEDGVTLVVPQQALGQLDTRRLGWLVPGLLEEKVTALIKSMPKDWRRKFVPVPETTREVLKRIEFGKGNFNDAIAKVLSEIAGEPVPADAFEPARLPGHLRMNVRVVDDQQQTLTQSRNVNEIRKEMSTPIAEQPPAPEEAEWHRDGITQWDFGDLPESIQVVRGGVKLPLYPALIDDGKGVALRLLQTKPMAELLTRAGLCRLFLISAKRKVKTQVDWFDDLDRWLTLSSTLKGFDFRKELSELLVDRAFLADQPLPRTPKDFWQRLKLGENQLQVVVQDVVKLVPPLMENWHRARVALEDLQASSWQEARGNMQWQMYHLTRPGFFTSTHWNWLHQYPRYFQAIQARAEKLRTGGLEKDQQCMAQIQPHEQRYQQQLQHNRDLDRYDRQLDHYRWMIEEFRVSLFAQQLRTAISVSAKRLDEQWEKVQRD